jgi:hypothetical protein
MSKLSRRSAAGNVVIAMPKPSDRGFNFAELEFRIDQLAPMATIANAQVVRTLCDNCPDDPPELSVFAVTSLRDMVHDLKKWHDAQPWNVDDRTLGAMRVDAAS